MVNTSVLVLNRLYQPVHITTVRRAFIMLYQGVARAVDEQYRLFDFRSWSELSAELTGDCISTIERKIRVPRVILLTAYERLPKIRIRFSRFNIYSRDSNTCQYCGKVFPRHELNLDHVIPRSRGGETSWENVVCSCVTCNLKKGGRTPREAGMKLLRPPSRPRWNPLLPSLMKIPYREWLPFLTFAGASYWNTELIRD